MARPFGGRRVCSMRISTMSRRTRSTGFRVRTATRAIVATATSDRKSTTTSGRCTRRFSLAHACQVESMGRAGLGALVLQRSPLGGTTATGWQEGVIGGNDAIGLRRLHSIVTHDFVAEDRVKVGITPAVAYADRFSRSALVCHADLLEKCVGTQWTQLHRHG